MSPFALFVLVIVGFFVVTIGGGYGVFWLFFQPIYHSWTCPCRRCAWSERSAIRTAKRRGDMEEYEKLVARKKAAS